MEGSAATATTRAAVLELSGVSKTYSDGTQALAAMSLTLEAGVMGVLGPNGAGKTTLLRILTQELEPSTGSLHFGGTRRTSSNRQKISRSIGYLAQEFEPIAELSATEYLLLTAQMRAVPLSQRALRRRVTRLLERVDLDSVAHRRTGTYSGGMRRRVGLARALLHAPQLLVVDEPTAGLDPEERIRFRHLITDVGEEIAVLLSTHIVEDIEATCPRILALDEGRVHFDGTPAELLEGVRGRLAWVEEPPADAIDLVSRRPHEGRARPVYLCRGPVSDSSVEPTLEEAYAGLLVERLGHRLGDAP